MSDSNANNNYTPSGRQLKVFTWPAPVLTKKAVSVTLFDSSLKALCDDMLTTMYHAPGIGLAAPQVGRGIRLFVAELDYNREKIMNADGEEEISLSNFSPKVFINPIILKKDGELLYEEGCLSVPGVYEEVKRAENITVEYSDLEGKRQTLDATGTLAVVIQHETDHLDGIVFLERLSLLKRNMIKKKIL